MAKLECGGLKWVKKEIDASLKQASISLNDYVDDVSESQSLRDCLTHLRLIHGVLQILELYGAALLSEEMEELGMALLSQSIQQKEEAYDVLMRAMIQMPDYLERIQNGAVDTPIVLLPLLNDLRAIRGDKLLSESAMFSPDLDILISYDHLNHHGNIQQLTQKSRHQYQLALLGWYKNQQTKKQLKNKKS
jgi:chemosensory pili system protein ChpA (sensor histidine kinase/response regulator)